MKYSLVSKKAIESNFNKSQLFKKDPKNDFSGWVIISSKEDKELYDIASEEFEVIENELIELYLPEFKHIKHNDTNSIFVHNEALDRLVEINREITEYLSVGSFATNQSNINVDFQQWFKHESQPLLKYYIGIFFAILLIPITAFLSGLVIFYIYRKIREYKEEIREYYTMGDTIPGVVTNINPTTIAGMTDLSKGLGYYPIIKIFNLKTTKISGKKIKVGDRIPLTTIYFSREGSNLEHWINIESFPVEFATKDKNKIAEKIYSISILDWNKLNESLGQIKNNSRPGLYKIDIEKSDWVTQ